MLNSVGVLLGNGDGSFQPTKTIALGATPTSAALADVNHDGKLDIVTTGSPGSQNWKLLVLLGNGNGTFQSPRNFALEDASSIGSLVVADVNGDGNTDVVIESDSGSVGVLLGSGDGNFGAVRTFASVGNGPLAVADLNHDHKPDVVTVTDELDTGLVSILIGNGDGTFSAPQTSSVPGGSDSAVISDVNGDGVPDIIMADYGPYTPTGDSPNCVGVLMGNGDGTFQAQRTFGTGPGPISAAVADVNGDGKPDIISANADSHGVSVLMGNGDGSFAPHVDFSTGFSPHQVVPANLRSEGVMDLAVMSRESLDILINSSPGGRRLRHR